MRRCRSTIGQASVVDTDLGKVKGGTPNQVAHFDNYRGQEWWISRIETSKHFGLNITGRALLYHSDKVTLSRVPSLKDFFGCTPKRH
jgi:hypothetical protein